MENRETPQIEYSSMIERFQKTHIGQNVLHTALKEVKTPEEAQKFYEEYVKLVGEIILSGDAEKTAKDNIKMVLSQSDAPTQERWQGVL